MQTLIRPQLKVKMAKIENSTYEVKEKSNNLKSGIDFKFYQKLFVIIFASCAFLIFPESPKDSEIVCNKYHSIEACFVW